MKWLRSLALKKRREAEGVFVAEGPKVVDDLLAAGFEPVYVGAELSWLDAAGALDGVPVDVLSHDELCRVSALEAPQGVVAVLRVPRWGVDAVAVAREGLCLALDGVQNPGNVGTILRVADWFGIGHVFCSAGCADVWGAKVVQAAMGAFAHVRVHTGVDLAAVFSRARDAGVAVCGTALDGRDIYGSPLPRSGFIVMGNEGRGLSAGVSGLLTDRLTVPSWAERHVDSLNVAVATAVVCAEFRRRGR